MESLQQRHVAILGGQLTTLPWADATAEALARYREQQPTPEELERVDAYQTTPVEMLACAFRGK